MLLFLSLRHFRNYDLAVGHWLYNQLSAQAPLVLACIFGTPHRSWLYNLWLGLDSLTNWFILKPKSSTIGHPWEFCKPRITKSFESRKGVLNLELNRKCKGVWLHIRLFCWCTLRHWLRVGRASTDRENMAPFFPYPNPPNDWPHNSRAIPAVGLLVTLHAITT
jgi:hypothetical protein